MTNRREPTTCCRDAPQALSYFGSLGPGVTQQQADRFVLRAYVAR